MDQHVGPLGQEERARLIDGLGQPVIATDLQGRVTYWNAAAESVYGWTAKDALGKDVMDLTVPEFRVLRADGAWTWVEGLITDLHEDPHVLGLVWTLRDISERRAALERMTEIALHDPLTGLPNRVLLADRLAQATAHREPHGALLFIDIDDFKQINDEFLMLNESLSSREEALALAERVGRSLAEPMEIDGHVITPLCSIGVAMLAGVHDPDRVINLADEDMYRVKQQHRSDVGS